MGYSNKEFKGLPMHASITVIFFYLHCHCVAILSFLIIFFARSSLLLLKTRSDIFFPEFPNNKH